MNVEQMRKQYARNGISKSDLDRDPMVQFGNWFEESVAGCDQDWMESNAMTLSTSDPSGYVTSRVVLLKGYDSSGFMFFTNYDSQKGKQLTANSQASLLFYWGHLERQVRVEGTVERTSSEISDEYFQSRPRMSQLSAAVSAQSEKTASRKELEAAVIQLEDALDGAAVPRPENWGGFLLSPTHFEFWQGRLNRLHDRLVYVQKNDDWIIERIQP